MTDPRFRTATRADVDAIAALHVRVWQHSYRSLAPAAAHAQLTEAHRRRGWAALISGAGCEQGAIVAETRADIVGVIGFGPAHAPAFGGRGEVKHLYVDRVARGRGIGQRLMAMAAQRFDRAGLRGMGLSVVVGNDAALQFYSALGGRIEGQFRDPGPLWRSENLMIVWDDLPLLSARAKTADQ